MCSACPVTVLVMLAHIFVRTLCPGRVFRPTVTAPLGIRSKWICFPHGHTSYRHLYVCHVFLCIDKTTTEGLRALLSSCCFSQEDPFYSRIFFPSCKATLFYSSIPEDHSKTGALLKDRMFGARSPESPTSPLIILSYFIFTYFILRQNMTM